MYGPINGGWHILRTLTLLKTKREKQIGIGEDYDYEPIPFGECWTGKNWAFNGEVEVFSFLFDFTYIADHYNREAKKHSDWKVVLDTNKLMGLKTRLPCRYKGIDEDHLAMKVTKHRPNTYIMEYDNFLTHLSYYLPHSSLRDNDKFVKWLRTPGLSD